MNTKEHIFGNSTYIIYDDGRVYSKNMNRFLTIHNKGNGYLCVNLWDGKKSKQFYVHRLVAINFISNNYNLPDVNHIDLNKSNNHISNLEWMSRKENMTHAKDNGAFESKQVERKINQAKWVGQIIGTREIIDICDEKNKSSNYKVLVKCECGNILKVYYNDFKKNKHNKCIKCK